MRSSKYPSYVRSSRASLNGLKPIWPGGVSFLQGKRRPFFLYFLSFLFCLLIKTNVFGAVFEQFQFIQNQPIGHKRQYHPILQLAQNITSSSSKSSQVVAVDIVGDTEKTVVQVTLTKAVKPQIYTLRSPDRVFIDFPNVEFTLLPDKPAIGRGLVQTYRYGEIAEKKARLVLDTLGPVKITRSTETKTGNGDGVVLLVELSNVNSQILDLRGAPPPSIETKTSSITEKNVGPTHTTSKSTNPIIVIDPGHGGIDPGAIGSGNLLEKNLVLKVAQKLSHKLSSTGHYIIVLTRNTDDFVSLDERLKISQSQSADLFISLHADSFDQAMVAQSIKGATVYTLSEQASDAEARAMAEKENASDLAAGISYSEQRDDVQVKNILMDLILRETSNFSTEFSRFLIRNMRSNITLSRSPERSAKFKVLRQAHTPAVLVELGYISNAKEADIMTSEAWQTKVCDAIARAIDTYFNVKSAGRAPN